MILFFTTLMLASGFLLNPPATCSWVYAKLQPVGGWEEQAKTCGVSEVEVLSSSVYQLATDGFTEKEQIAYRSLVQQLEERYMDASSQERAGLVAEFIKLRGTERLRLTGQTWIKMGPFLVHYLTVADGKTGNYLMKFEDETTGQYIAYLLENKNKSGIGGLIKRLLDSDPEDEERAGIVKEIDQAGREQTLRVDVNGVVLYIDRGNPGADDDFRHAYSLMWNHLPEGDGKHRIEMAIPIVWKAIYEEALFSRVQLKWATDPERTPHDLCLILKSEFGETQVGGDLLSMETPPEEILKDFFGKPKMPLPDPDWSFKKLRKNLL